MVLTDFRALKERRESKLPPHTSCYRWVDHEQPGVTVDCYGSVAVMSLYHQAPDERALAEKLATVPGIESVYVKRRPREARKVANENVDVLAPATPLVGAPVDSLIVTECGARFEIRPGNGLSVGLYLDARDARAWVQENARGRRVLNTFAYTCGFGTVAHRGGASRALNLDVSRKVLDWGERNLALNGFEPDHFDFISGDGFDWLSRLAKKGELFDLVILDPPGFSTTRSTRFTAQRDYHLLVAAAQQLVAPSGLLLAMCNVEQQDSKFDEQIERGLGRRTARWVKRFGASPIDFQVPSALKCQVLELGPRSIAPNALGNGNAPR